MESWVNRDYSTDAIRPFKTLFDIKLKSTSSSIKFMYSSAFGPVHSSTISARRALASSVIAMSADNPILFRWFTTFACGLVAVSKFDTWKATDEKKQSPSPATGAILRPTPRTFQVKVSLIWAGSCSKEFSLDLITSFSFINETFFSPIEDGSRLFDKYLVAPRLFKPSYKLHKSSWHLEQFAKEYCVSSSRDGLLKKLSLQNFLLCL